MVAGLTQHYPDTIRPALQVIRVKTGARVAGVYMMVFKNDRQVSSRIRPSSSNLPPKSSRISRSRRPRWRSDSTSNRVSRCCRSRISGAPSTRCRRECAVRPRWSASERPELEVDGEMQADTAVVDEILAETYPFSRLQRARKRSCVSLPRSGQHRLQAHPAASRRRGRGPDPRRAEQALSTCYNEAPKSTRSSTWPRSQAVDAQNSE